MTKVFGDWIKDLGFYRFKHVTHEGIPMIIARMGYSRELCYELFLQDSSKGNDLWELLWQAGRDLNISAGGPNIILRLEGGILSYLADIDRTNNPYEVGLDWLVDLDQEDDFIGKEALREIIEEEARELIRRADRISKHAGRTTIVKDDIHLAK